MSKDIPVMKELQYLRNNILDREAGIERSMSSKETYGKNLKKLEQELLLHENKLKSLKGEVKELELQLREVEEKATKLEGQFAQLKSQREIDAHNRELVELKSQSDGIETELIDKMENQDSLEAKISNIAKELEEKRVQVGGDMKLLDEKIEKLDGEKGELESQFEEQSEKLSPSVKSRFLKLIKSKDGIAIAQASGEICGHCNCQIPSSLASSINKGELSNCTNCGRYLYKQG